jgi:hypothetical protein
MSDLGTFLAIVGVGVGSYAIYRWLNPETEPGHWRQKEKQNLKDAHVSGYFAGVQSGPAIVGADYAGYYTGAGYAGHYVGDGHAPAPPDPRNCLCPMSLDPLDPGLPVYKCPCNVPGAIRPPYAGYMAVGRGGGRGGGGHHWQHRQQQQQQDQQQDEQQGDDGGMGGGPMGPGGPGGGPGGFPGGPGQFGGHHPGFGGGHQGFGGHPGFHPQHFGRR